MPIKVDASKPLLVTVSVGKAEKGRYEINFISADQKLVERATGRSDDDIEDTHSFDPDKLASGAIVEWEIWISTPTDESASSGFEASVSFKQSGQEIESFEYVDETSPIWSYVTLEVA